MDRQQLDEQRLELRRRKASAADPVGAAPGGAVVHRLGADVRVWLLNLLMAIAVGWLFLVERTVAAPAPGASPASWIVIALAFAAAEIWVVHFQFRKEAHTISLSEIPLTVGLFFLSPALLVLAQLAGTLPALLFHRRQSPLKLVFNVLQFILSTEVAVVVFHAGIAKAGPLGPQAWLVAVLATLCSSAVGIATVSAAITLVEGRLGTRGILTWARFSIAGTAVNTSLALVGVVTIYRDPRASALLLLPAGALYLAYRAYTQERQKTERIEFLYNSGRLLAAGEGGEPGVVHLLREALAMFRAEIAEVAVWAVQGGEPYRSIRLRGGLVEESSHPTRDLWPQEVVEEIGRSDSGVILHELEGTTHQREFLAARGLHDAVITTLRADTRVIGAMLIGNRQGNVGGFNAEHVSLLETLAAQVGAAVENERLERVLHHQAFHDSLTGLANRALLNRRLEGALERPDQAVAVLMIDVDEFKGVNDTLGHSVGDQLLVITADRLREATRAGDTAARIGGDEFAVLALNISSEADAEAAAERILDTFRAPVELAGRRVRASASIGIATNLDGLLDPGTLLLQADVAMYAAKAAQRGTYRLFQTSMQDEVAERRALRDDLSLAIERGDLVNHYQPLVDLDGHRVRAVEALVRWNHPERGLVSPVTFIGIAEESGLIIDLGAWVLRTACAQLREWQRAYPQDPPLTVSVNLSAVQLRQPGFVDTVVEILRDTDLDAHCLTLEITESTFMEDPRAAIARLRELRGLGVRLELDDFGTGFSSLSILRDLPLDGLKIDKSFVDHIHVASDRPAFLQAIVRLAEALSLEMVAEGIEQPEQAEALRHMGCEKGQGYFFSRPLPAADLAAYLASRRELEPTVGSVVPMPRRRRSD